MRGLERFALAQKTPEKIQEQYPVAESEPPAEPGELQEDDPWLEVLVGISRDLRAEYVNSPSSCDPPVKILHVPEHDDDEASPSSRRAAMHSVSKQPSPSELSASYSSRTRFVEPAEPSFPSSYVDQTLRKNLETLGAAAMSSLDKPGAPQSQSPPKPRTFRVQLKCLSFSLCAHQCFNRSQPCFNCLSWIPGEGCVLLASRWPGR